MLQLLAITPNPAWDKTYYTPELGVGKVHRVNSQRALAGGKGANVARVASTLAAQRGLDLQVIAGGIIGGLTGEAWVNDLVAAGIQTCVRRTNGETRTSLAIVPASDPADTSVFNEAGPTLTAAEISEFINTLPQANAAAGGAIATVSGSLPPGWGEASYKELVATLKTKGWNVFADASGPALIWAAEAGADLVKPNLDELSEATGETEMSAGVKYLKSLGAEDVMITDGKNGLLAQASDGSFVRAKLSEVLSGNPTGAGDAAFAACVVAALEQLDVNERVQLAVATSAAAVLQPTAGVIDPADVSTLLSKTEIHHEA